MAWKEWNPNPLERVVGDCVIRALSKALNTDWESAFVKVSANAYEMADMPSSDSVWASVLRQNGFYRKAIPNTCPDCYTVSNFAQEHPTGTYVLALGGHVVTVQDGDWYDTWDSGGQVPQYYWYKAKEE